MPLIVPTIAPEWQPHELSLTRSLTLDKAGRYACVQPLAQQVLNRAEAVKHRRLAQRE